MRTCAIIHPLHLELETAPYYAVTDATGSFSIEDLPPGTYRLKAWHPILGTKEQELTVAPNETISLDLSFEANR
jgi:hypothetical protein